MKRKLLVLAALLSLCVLLAACKKSDDTISTPASTATSSAEPEATPEPTLPPYEANVLTGEPKGADYPEGQRITAVMVNNIVAARPQRTLALEHTMYTNSDNIQEYIDNNKVDMNKTYNSTFFNFVDYRLGTTRDLSTSIDSAYTDKYGPVVGDGEYVEIVHSQSYKTRFIYDSASNTYKMQQNYSDGQWRDTVDEAADNKVLTFPNVIVLYTDIHTYPGHEAKDLQYAEYAWGGIGYYCYGGKCEKIYWQKGTPLEALRLYYLTEDGQCSDTPVEINTGKSYVAVTDVDFAGNFVHSKLDGVDLSSATTVTYERSYVEDDAKAGDTLGMSTDDLTNNATGAGEAEDTTSGESYTEDTTGSEETTGDTTGGEEHVEPSADGEETPAE